MSNDNNGNGFWNIHTTADAAYLNRLRLVTPDQGEPYFAVTLACLRGKADSEGKIPKTYVDCTVSGTLAKRRIKTLYERFDTSNAKIMAIAPRFGDLKLEPFTYGAHSPKAGEPGKALRGRLIKLEKVLVDGQPFDFQDEGYQSEKSEPVDPNPTPAQSSEPDEGNAHVWAAPNDVQPEDKGNIRGELPPGASGIALPTVVKLSSDDPLFKEKKNALEWQGYVFDGTDTWFLLAA